MIIINKKIINFKWAGWHPNCRCYVIAIIKSEERFWEDEDKRGTDNEPITEMPENFNKWASLNQDRIARAEQRGTQPYFVRDNRERVKQAVKQGDVMRENKGDYILNSSGTPPSDGGDKVGRFLDTPISKKEAISRLKELATNYDHEEAYVYLPDGRVYHKKGVLNKVPLSVEELKLFEGGVFIHNHPNTTFSPNDIITAIKYKFKEIRVITSSNQYKAVTSSFNLDKSSMEDIKQLYNTAIKHVEEKIKSSNSRVAEGIISNMQHYEIKEFLKLLKVNYIVTSLKM